MKKLILLAMMLPLSAYPQDKLNLKNCRTLALEHNQRIKAAAENEKAAGSLKKAAYTQFFPRFNIDGTYTWFNREFELLEDDLLFPVVSSSSIGADGKVDPAKLDQTSLMINPATGMPVTDGDGNPVFQNYGWIPSDQIDLNCKSVYLINAGITQPLYTGGKIKETYKIAGYTEDIAASKSKLTTTEILYKVETYYWQVISLQQKVELAEKYVELLDKLVNDLDNYYQEGFITNNDLLKAKVKKNEANLHLMKAKNGVSLSKMALAQLIGYSGAENMILDDSQLNNLKPDKITDINTSYDSRAELDILSNTVNIAQSGVNLMKSRYLPTLAMTAGYLVTNPNPYNGFKNDFGGGLTAGIACHIPVFHWGDKKHTLRAAKAELESSKLKLDETDELIALQVKQAVYKLTESRKNLSMAESNLEQAEENLRITQSNFKEGMVKTTDILEAQTLWQNAQATVIDAQSDFLLNKTLVKKVTGQLK